MKTKMKSCFCNRELSWLKFNERVLNEAGNPRVPLAERLTFASIYQSNLDEFYMVRVGTLMDQTASGEIVRENKTNMTSAEQVKAILSRTRELNEKKEVIYEQLMGELEPQGIRLINFRKLSVEEGTLLEKYFDSEIAPFLSPVIVSKQQPFPFLKNKEIYAALILETKAGKTRLAVIPCSNNVFKRLIEIPTRPGTFMLSEELILHFAPKLFSKYTIHEKSLMRLTRNADINAQTLYDEDLDYRSAMENLIKQRKKLNPVRMEFSRRLEDKNIKRICKYADVNTAHVFRDKTPLDMSFVFQLQNYLRGKQDLNSNEKSLFYPKRTPRKSPVFVDCDNVLKKVEEQDVLLSYPFETITPFINMLHEAAKASDVVSIKMTLYRLADRSKIVEALIEAAENGKEVVVLVELRARFDEENNIEWSRKLEDAGCQVIYGLGDYKVHSKLCLITRKTESGLSYITQIGTGNYNEKTSTLYTDLSLITASREIGEEAAGVFAALLMGETVKAASQLLVAPDCLQNKVVEMIDAEIEHAKSNEAAYIGLKLNSLTDKVIIDKLIEASQAGVKIEMVIRGICCLVAGVHGYTDNIKIISIVGRYLEHSRIYMFGTKERRKIYIASADFMTRNTVRRVEVAAPIYDEKIKERLEYMFEMMINDTEKGKIMNPSGFYLDRTDTENKINSQELFYQEAYDAVTD